MARTGQQESSQANQELQQQQAAANAATMNSINKYDTDLGTLHSGKNPFANPY